MTGKVDRDEVYIHVLSNVLWVKCLQFKVHMHVVHFDCCEKPSGGSSAQWKPWGIPSVFMVSVHPWLWAWSEGLGVICNSVGEVVRSERVSAVWRDNYAQDVRIHCRCVLVHCYLWGILFFHCIYYDSHSCTWFYKTWYCKSWTQGMLKLGRTILRVTVSHNYYFWFTYFVLFTLSITSWRCRWRLVDDWDHFAEGTYLKKSLFLLRLARGLNWFEVSTGSWWILVYCRFLHRFDEMEVQSLLFNELGVSLSL